MRLGWWSDASRLSMRNFLADCGVLALDLWCIDARYPGLEDTRRHWYY